MKKFLKVFLIIGIVIQIACSTNPKINTYGLKVGGLYTLQNDNGTYGITKILAIDDYSVHVIIYDEEFNSKPEKVKTSELNYLIGHAPIDIKGYMRDKPELIHVENVSDGELEGYTIYKEELKKR